MKILIAVGLFILLQSVNAKAPCPMTNPELISCKPDQKISQIIDTNGCLIWSCVTKHPFCCRRAPPPATLCAGDESSIIDEVMDPKTGCPKWTCVPKRPRCCVETFPKKCKMNFYSVEVTDPKTGCLIWKCIACPNIYDEKIECLNGYPIESTGNNGCPMWTCLEYTIDVSSTHLIAVIIHCLPSIY